MEKVRNYISFSFPENEVKIKNDKRGLGDSHSNIRGEIVGYAKLLQKQLSIIFFCQGLNFWI